MSTLDPITGPLDRETFKKLTDAPFGKATEIIRQYDPFWGPWGRRRKSDGRSGDEATGRGVALWRKLSAKGKPMRWPMTLTMDDIKWDDDFDILSVKPHVDPPEGNEAVPD